MRGAERSEAGQSTAEQKEAQQGAKRIYLGVEEQTGPTDDACMHREEYWTGLACLWWWKKGGKRGKEDPKALLAVFFTRHDTPEPNI